MERVKKRQAVPKAASKRTVSIEGLFKSVKHNQSQKPDTEMARTMHSLFVHPKNQQHPDHLRFLRASEQYCAGARACQVVQLDVAHDELVSQLDSLHSDGQEQVMEGMLGPKELKEFGSKSEALFEPLANDTLRLRTSEDQTETIKLGRSMKMYSKHVREKTAQVEALLAQLEQVDTEICVTRDAIAHDLDGTVEKATKNRDARLAEIKQRLEAAKASSLAEIVAAQKSEAENTKKFNMKLKGLMEDVAYS
nr:hypothetical protein CFP56_72508 [Quercus suber]